MPAVRELPAAGGRRVFYEVEPDAGRSADAGDVHVLRVYGPGSESPGDGSSSDDAMACV